MIHIAPQPGDEPAFIEIVSRFAEHAINQHSLALLYIVQLDHWFGDRWLGFQGKKVGAVGVHSRLLNNKLVFPPFHPHRVKSVTRFDRADFGVFAPTQVPTEHIHTFRTSESNTRNYIRDFGVYCWYSGDSDSSLSASVMVYVVSPQGNNAWYVKYSKNTVWKLAKPVAISAAECNRIVAVRTADDAT